MNHDFCKICKIIKIESKIFNVLILTFRLFRNYGGKRFFINAVLDFDVRISLLGRTPLGVRRSVENGTPRLTRTPLGVRPFCRKSRYYRKKDAPLRGAGDVGWALRSTERCTPNGVQKKQISNVFCPP
jgi:hypothetical protein